MDTSQLPEIKDYEDAVSKHGMLVNEAASLQGQLNQLQMRLAQNAAEQSYYQGAAKALQPTEE